MLLERVLSRIIGTLCFLSLALLNSTGELQHHFKLMHVNVCVKRNDVKKSPLKRDTVKMNAQKDVISIRMCFCYAAKFSR